VAKQAFLVDDSKSARIVMSRLLKKNGFDEVAMAESGEDALEQLKALTPDAIFVDFLMDGMDGLETISHIKKDARFVNTPVVMCTANEGANYVQAAVDHGALGILAKPPTDESLKDIIRIIEENSLTVDTIPSPEVEEPQVQEAAVLPFGGQQKPAAPVSAPKPPPAAPSIPAEKIAEIARNAAREAAEKAAVAVARESAEAAAKSVARESVEEMLAPLVNQMLEKRLQAFKPPEVDTEKLKGEVVSQVNRELEEFVRQINERSVSSMLEAKIHAQIHELANDFAARLQELKQDILAQVPEKNDMIEHIRVVTEGSLEAQVRELSTQVSQDVANTIATETVEQILDDHWADQLSGKEPEKKSSAALKFLWVLLAAAGAGVGYLLFQVLEL
jgi:CheY-like chemotaxis protein